MNIQITRFNVTVKFSALGVANQFSNDAIRCFQSQNCASDQGFANYKLEKAEIQPVELLKIMSNQILVANLQTRIASFSCFRIQIGHIHNIYMLIIPTKTTSHYHSICTNIYGTTILPYGVGSERMGPLKKMHIFMRFQDILDIDFISGYTQNVFYHPVLEEKQRCFCNL